MREMRLVRLFKSISELFSRKRSESAKPTSKPKLGLNKRLKPNRRKSRVKNKGEVSPPVSRTKSRSRRVIVRLFDIL